MSIIMRVLLLLPVYFLLICPFAFIFHLFKIRKTIEFKGCLPEEKGGYIIVYNHPTFVDPLALNFRFLRRMWFGAFSFPLVNFIGEGYFNHPFLFLIKQVCLPLKKGINRKSLVRTTELLEKRKIITIPLEGARTGLGEEFIFSEKGKKMKKIEDGIGWLIVKTDREILPVWFEVIGKEIEPGDLSLREIKKIISQLWKKETKIIGKIGQLSKVEVSKDEYVLKRDCWREASEKTANSLLALADTEEL